MGGYGGGAVIATTGIPRVEHVFVYPDPPEPGTRCATCNRRRNKPRQDTSPATREMRIKLPSERMANVEEAFDALQEVTGVDPYSYPKGVLLEALLVLGGQQREQLRLYFKGRE